MSTNNSFGNYIQSEIFITIEGLSFNFKKNNQALILSNSLSYIFGIKIAFILLCAKYSFFPPNRS